MNSSSKDNKYLDFASLHVSFRFLFPWFVFLGQSMLRQIRGNTSIHCHILKSALLKIWALSGTSLVVQWLGPGSFNAMSWVQTLVEELRSHKAHRGAKKGAFLHHPSDTLTSNHQWFLGIIKIPANNQISTIPSEMASYRLFCLNQDPYMG